MLSPQCPLTPCAHIVCESRRSCVRYFYSESGLEAPLANVGDLLAPFNPNLSGLAAAAVRSDTSR